MDRSDVKRILYSLKDNTNEEIITSVLAKLDRLTDENISQILSQIGDSETAVKGYLNNIIYKQLVKRHEHEHDHNIPLNDYITYGKTGSTLHLHLPVDLHASIQKDGFSRTIDRVNLYLLDAIDRVVDFRKKNSPAISEIDEVYMISPILIRTELKFLKELGFTTQSFSKKQLSDPEFLQNSSEAVLANKLFGSKNNVSSAKIPLDTLLSTEWQKKKEEAKGQIHKKGIYLPEDSKSLDEK